MEGYLRLLEKQVDKNRQIHAFAKRQRDAIAAGDMGIVMESDCMRRQIIAQLQLLQLEMDSYLKRLPDELQNLSDHLRDQIVAVSSELKGVIDEIIAIDLENAIKLRSLREALGERIEEVGKGKKALHGYKNSPRRSSKLFHGAV